jgi:glyoxylase-like metal-dependent hydrolase (beta-lactamase superfamily II)
MHVLFRRSSLLPLCVGFAVLVPSACAPPREAEAIDDVTVHSVRVDSTNVGVVEGPGGVVLIDIGLAGAFDKLEPELEARGIALGDITRTFVTHAHGDHAGDTAAVQAAGIPVWVHEEDADNLESGEHDETEIIGVEAAILAPFVLGPFEGAAPEGVFTDDLTLEEAPAEITHVGGHTAGSVVAVVGGRTAFVGDLIRGGSLGGAVDPGTPQVHYFHEDRDAAHEALRNLLVDHPGVETIWPAHGDAFTRERLQSFLDAL